MPSSEQIALAAISSLSALIILFLLILAVCNFNRKNGCRYTSFMMSFVATGVLYIIYNVLKCYTALAADHVIADNVNACQLYWQCYQFYIFGKFGMYLFYSTRVFQTFKGSAFQLSRRHYKTLMLAITIYYIAISAAFMAEVFQWGDFEKFPIPPKVKDGTIDTWEDCVHHTTYWAAQSGMIIKIVFLYSGETFFGVVLLRLYVRKVLLLLKNQLKFRDIEVSMNSVRTVSRSRTATEDKNSRTGSGSNHQQNANQDEEAGNSSVDDAFLQVAVKSTNLYLFSCITSLCAAFMFDQIGLFLLDLDSVVNYFCMYLTFVFAKQWYGVMCYGTHKCCWSVCVASVFQCCMMDCCACECGQNGVGNGDVQQELSTAVNMGNPTPTNDTDNASGNTTGATSLEVSAKSGPAHVTVATESALPTTEQMDEPPPETR